MGPIRAACWRHGAINWADRLGGPDPLSQKSPYRDRGQAWPPHCLSPPQELQWIDRPRPAAQRGTSPMGSNWAQVPCLPLSLPLLAVVFALATASQLEPLRPFVVRFPPPGWADCSLWDFSAPPCRIYAVAVTLGHSGPYRTSNGGGASPFRS